MQPNVVQLAQDLVAINSVSRRSNAEISDYLENTLKLCSFDVERLEYVDENDELKVSLVAKKGQGPDGLGLFSHSDTVPGNEWAWKAFTPAVEDGRLRGRGSCDMKGPLAATLAAAAAAEARQLKRPVFIVVTADEEINGGGAKYVAQHSKLLRDLGPKHGVIAEPTRMIPVRAHKGGASVKVTAHGKAAHTSTDRGVSANFLIAPFLAEMAELAKRLKTDESYMNQDFDPPTNGFNLVLDDGGCKPNVTAAKTVCTVGFRPMPNDRSAELIEEVTACAQRYNLEVESRQGEPFSISANADIVRAGLQATGVTQAETVPFGTDAVVFKEHFELVILGPGDIAQAHTIGEWIEISQLERAVGVYKRMIDLLCA